MKHVAQGFGGMWDLVFLVPVMLLPHPGFQWSPGAPRPYRATLSWPASRPFGPVTSRVPQRCYEETFQSHRLVLEPGLVLDRPLVVFLRPGYRFIWHPAGARLGLGGGLGSTWEVTDRSGLGVRASVSPELLVHLGRCCSDGYWLASVRFDYFLSGDSRVGVTANLGATMW